MSIENEPDNSPQDSKNKNKMSFLERQLYRLTHPRRYFSKVVEKILRFIFRYPLSPNLSHNDKNSLKYHSDVKYHDRKTKASYVYDKYSAIMAGRVLDVGSDQCYLKNHLDDSIEYVGIGLGGEEDLKVDLEKDEIPFEDDSFDCVLCLDVLEHLDNIHDVFKKLCSISKRYVILSLPNNYSVFYSYLKRGDSKSENLMKFYGLPVEPPNDRHKWFFGASDAISFVQYQAEKNDYNLIQWDAKGADTEGGGVKGFLKLLVRDKLFSNDLEKRDLFLGTLWFVLEKNRVN